MSNQNAVKHGIRRSIYALRNENEQDFLAIEADFLQTYQPQGPAEQFLVEQMIMCRWRSLRIWAVDTAGIDLQMDQDGPAFAITHTAADEPTRTAYSMRKLADDSSFPELMHRYETRYSRAFDRALTRLEYLQRRRQKQLKVA